MAKDPVCGMEVDEKTAKHRAEYQGKTYYFCGPAQVRLRKGPGKVLEIADHSAVPYKVPE